MTAHDWARVDAATARAAAHRRGRLHASLCDLVTRFGDVRALRDGRASEDLATLEREHGRADLGWMIGVVESDVAEGIEAEHRRTEP